MVNSNVLLINLPEHISDVLIPLIEQELQGHYKLIISSDIAQFLHSDLDQNDFIVCYNNAITEDEIVHLNTRDDLPVALITAPFSFEMERTAKAHNISTILDENDADLITLIYGFIRQYHIYQNQHALIVDDSRVDSYILSNALKSEFVKNTIELRAEYAIERIKENPAINIIILDYEMPHINGCQLMKAIKEAFFNRDFIFIGLTGSRNGAIKFLTQGVDDVFIKPLDQELFSVTLRKLIFNFHRACQNKNAFNDYKNILKSVTKGIYDPVYVLLTINECLLEKTIDQSDIDRVKALCAKSKDKLTHTFDDLLSYLEVTSYIQSPMLKHCSLQSMISAQLYLESSRAKMRNIMINQSFDPSSKKVHVPQQIEQVISYFTHHAITQSHTDSEVNIRLFMEDTHVVFEVENHQAPAEQNHQTSVKSSTIIQQSYENLSKEHPLNFSMCSKVIDNHGGSLGVKQGENGNIFYFKLPMSSAALSASGTKLH